MGKPVTKAGTETRELFIEELAEVTGGGPVEELLRKIGCCETTMACCEEGPDNCCSPW